jgi:RimJ/RimL family protein N-acetyltransferase
MAAHPEALMDTPVLETKRLILRRPVAEDFEGWAALMGDEENARHVGGLMTRALAWRMMASVIGARELRGFTLFSAIEKESQSWVGWVGPWQPEGWPGREVGWSLLKAHWGKGYATEGAEAAFAYVFEKLGWDDVIHCIEPLNARSIALAERLGSVRLRSARLPPPQENQVLDIYGQTRAAWRARKAR